MESVSDGFQGDQPDTVELVKTLRTIPLLSEMGRDYLLAIVRYSQEIYKDAGGVLVREGDTDTGLAVILEGEARVERNGKRIAHLQTGEFFGEMALIDGLPRSATVIAETAVRLLLVDSDLFNSLLDSDAGLWRKLALVLCTRLRARDEETAV